MDHLPLGKTKIHVSPLCIGTWQAHGWAGSDDGRIIQTIQRGLDLGLNFIDTAPGYGNGHSEQLVGKAVAGKRADVVIATKVGPTDSAPNAVRKSIEKSLRDLGTDYIDLLQHHWPPKKPPLDETIGEFVKLKDEGVIRAIGVSNYMEPEFEELTKLDVIDSLQPCYSLLWRTVEKNVIPICRANSISVLPYSPLCQGILAGKFHDRSAIPNDPRKRNRFLSEKLLPETLKVVDAVETIAKKYQRSPSQVALRWLLENDAVTAPIVGATTPEQLEDNVGALTFQLEAEDYQYLSQVSEQLGFAPGPHESLWNWHPRAV